MQFGKRRTMPAMAPAGELATADPSTMGRDWGPQAMAAPSHVSMERGPDPMAQAPEAWQPSLINRLGGMLAGVNKDALVAQHGEQERAGREGADRSALVAGLGDRERLAYYANPEQWGGRVSENVGSHQIAGGNTLLRPGFGITTAPKLTEAGGIMGTQTADGWKQTGERGLGAPETAQMESDAAKMALDRDKLASLDEYRGGQLGLGGQRVAIAKAKAAAKGGVKATKPGAGGGTPWANFGGQR